LVLTGLAVYDRGRITSGETGKDVLTRVVSLWAHVFGMSRSVLRSMRLNPGKRVSIINANVVKIDRIMPFQWTNLSGKLRQFPRDATRLSIRPGDHRL